MNESKLVGKEAYADKVDGADYRFDVERSESNPYYVHVKSIDREDLLKWRRLRKVRLDLSDEDFVEKVCQDVLQHHLQKLEKTTKVVDHAQRRFVEIRDYFTVIKGASR